MKIILGMLLSSIFLLGSCNGSFVSGEANSYFVSSIGSDRYPGTFERPFKTIQRACDILEPGDKLYIRGGEYQEKIVLNRTGIEKAYITIQPFEQERVILDGNKIKDKSNLIYIQDKSFIRIKGLELRNSHDGDTPAGIMVEGYGEGIELLNNKIYNVESNENAHGIAVYGTNGSKSIQGIRIEGNEVYNCKLGSSESVVVNGNVENFRISNNLIHDNDNIGIDCIGFENTAPRNDQARNGVVTGNEVYNISSAENPAYEGDACAAGIYVDGGKDILIEGNIVYNCDIGIEVASEHYGQRAERVMVRSNLIYLCGLYGFSLGGASHENGSAENCIFSNNTLNNNHVGINLQKSRDNKLYNNIIYETGSLLEGEMGSNSFDFNLWYSPKGNYQKMNNFGDPRFVNPKGMDFRLEAGSPAIDAGDPAYKTDKEERDVAGNSRVGNGRIDCGAFEYIGE